MVCVPVPVAPFTVLRAVRVWAPAVVPVSDVDASPERPYLAVALRLDWREIAALMLEAPKPPFGAIARDSRAMSTGAVTAPLIQAFDRPVFHETVLKLPRSAGEVLDGLLARGILGGFDLSGDYPELGNALLVCATETKEEGDLQRYAEALAAVV